MIRLHLILAVLCEYTAIRVSSYDNLSLLDTTNVSQSSTYHYQYPWYAVDDNLDTIFHKCAHTKLNVTSPAWFQIDLGKSYSLFNVYVLFRSEVTWKPHRARQFYVDVSNSSALTSNTIDRIRCYKDNTVVPYFPSNPSIAPCRQTARYVIIESTYDSPEDTEYGAILEICEVKVMVNSNEHFWRKISSKFYSMEEEKKAKHLKQ